MSAIAPTLEDERDDGSPSHIADPDGTGGTAAPAVAVRRANVIAGRLLMAIGASVVLFLLFEFVFANISHGRSQVELLRAFQGEVAEGVALDPAWVPPEGTPVAIVEIPKLGVRQVVIEGTTPALLKEAPGHFRNTPLPGQAGNAVIAGRRATYGAPFGGLDGLVKGDSINIVTGLGTFTYLVEEVTTIQPGEPDVLVSTVEPQLTLVTSNPALVADERLAVVAALDGLPASATTRAPVPIGSEETGMRGDMGALGPLLLWAELLLLVIVGAWWLYRRGENRRVVYLLTTPVIVTLAFLTFENLDRLLPGTT